MHIKKGLLLALAVTVVGSNCFASNYYDSGLNVFPVRNRVQLRNSAEINTIEKKLNSLSPPDNYKVWMKLGDLYYADGRIAEAFETWISAIYLAKEASPSTLNDIQGILVQKSESNQNDEFYNIVLGKLFFNQGLYGEAVARYNKVLKLNSNNIQAQLALAELYSSNGQSEKALKTYENVIRLFPYEPNVHSLKAAVYEDMGLIDNAKYEYKNALLIEQSDNNAKVGLYNLLKKTTPPSELLVEIYPKYKKKPITADAYCSLAKDLGSAWDIDGAIEVYKIAIQAEPNNIRAVLALAEFCEKIDKIHLAKEELLAAKVNFKQDRESLHSINQLLVKYSEDPVREASQNILAGSGDDFFSYYENIKHKAVPAYTTMINEYISVENYEDARLCALKAVESYPNNKELSYLLAVTQDLSGDILSAKKTITKSLKLYPDDKLFVALSHEVGMKRLKILVKETLDAISESDNAKASEIVTVMFSEEEPDAMAYFCRGLLRSKMGNDQPAIDDLLISYEMDKNNSSTLRLLGQLYEPVNQELAMKYYQECLAVSLDPASTDSVFLKSKIDELTKIIPVNIVTPLATPSPVTISEPVKSDK